MDRWIEEEEERGERGRYKKRGKSERENHMMTGGEMMIGWMTGEGSSGEDRVAVGEERSRKECQRRREK